MRGAAVTAKAGNHFHLSIAGGGGSAGNLYAFWKEHVFGPGKTRMLEMESMTSLLVAKKVGGQWCYQRIRPAWKTGRPMVLNLAAARFHPDPSGRIARAVHTYQLLEVGNYLSELLTLAILFLLVQRLPTLRRRFSVAVA